MHRTPRYTTISVAIMTPSPMELIPLIQWAGFRNFIIPLKLIWLQVGHVPIISCHFPSTRSIWTLSMFLCFHHPSTSNGLSKYSMTWQMLSTSAMESARRQIVLAPCPTMAGNGMIMERFAAWRKKKVIDHFLQNSREDRWHRRWMCECYRIRSQWTSSQIHQSFRKLRTLSSWIDGSILSRLW